MLHNAYDQYRKLNCVSSALNCSVVMLSGGTTVLDKLGRCDQETGAASVKGDSANLCVISPDAQQSLCEGMPPGKLMQLAFSVKRRQVQPLSSSKADVTRPLACIGEHDSVCWHSKTQHGVCLPF